MSTAAALAFAAYIRTSTDDQQSPEDSRRWQLAAATRLVVPAGGVIVATYHDIDVTRELPWARRPEASRVLADAANPARGWTALVIAEPPPVCARGYSSAGVGEIRVDEPLTAPLRPYPPVRTRADDIEPSGPKRRR